MNSWDRLMPRDRAAQTKHPQRTLLSFFHASFTMKQTFCQMLYWGFSLDFIFHHLVRVSYHKNSSPKHSGDESFKLGDELQDIIPGGSKFPW